MHRGIGASKSHINLALRLLKKAAHKFNRKIKQFAFITEKKTELLSYFNMSGILHTGMGIILC